MSGLAESLVRRGAGLALPPGQQVMELRRRSRYESGAGEDEGGGPLPAADAGAPVGMEPTASTFVVPHLDRERSSDSGDTIPASLRSAPTLPSPQPTSNQSPKSAPDRSTSSLPNQVVTPKPSLPGLATDRHPQRPGVDEHESGAPPDIAQAAVASSATRRPSDMTAVEPPPGDNGTLPRPPVGPLSSVVPATPPEPPFASPASEGARVTISIGRIAIDFAKEPSTPTAASPRAPERTRGFAAYARARLGHRG
jgi:hypothetical protein